MSNPARINLFNASVEHKINFGEEASRLPNHHPIHDADYRNHIIAYIKNNLNSTDPIAAHNAQCLFWQALLLNETKLDYHKRLFNILIEELSESNENFYTYFAQLRPEDKEIILNAVRSNMNPQAQEKAFSFLISASIREKDGYTQALIDCAYQHDVFYTKDEQQTAVLLKEKIEILPNQIYSKNQQHQQDLYKVVNIFKNMSPMSPNLLPLFESVLEKLIPEKMRFNNSNEQRFKKIINGYDKFSFNPFRNKSIESKTLVSSIKKFLSEENRQNRQLTAQEKVQLFLLLKNYFEKGYNKNQKGNERTLSKALKGLYLALKEDITVAAFAYKEVYKKDEKEKSTQYENTLPAANKLAFSAPKKSILKTRNLNVEQEKANVATDAMINNGFSNYIKSEVAKTRNTCNFTFPGENKPKNPQGRSVNFPLSTKLGM